jgi:hypothetical protein
MKSKLFFSAFLALLLLVQGGCSRMESEKHKHLMKGQILDVVDNSVYLCIGSKDGAEAGDQFTVYRFERVVNPNPDYSPERPYYKREAVGRIKIVEVFEEHMAKAIILSGEAKPDYFVEMEE